MGASFDLLTEASITNTNMAKIKPRNIAVTVAADEDDDSSAPEVTTPEETSGEMPSLTLADPASAPKKTVGKSEEPVETVRFIHDISPAPTIGNYSIAMHHGVSVCNKGTSLVLPCKVAAALRSSGCIA